MPRPICSQLFVPAAMPSGGDVHSTLITGLRADCTTRSHNWVHFCIASASWAPPLIRCASSPLLDDPLRCWRLPAGMTHQHTEWRLVAKSGDRTPFGREVVHAAAPFASPSSQAVGRAFRLWSRPHFPAHSALSCIPILNHPSAPHKQALNHASSASCGTSTPCTRGTASG